MIEKKLEIFFVLAILVAWIIFFTLSFFLGSLIFLILIFLLLGFLIKNIRNKDKKIKSSRTILIFVFLLILIAPIILISRVNTGPGARRSAFDTQIRSETSQIRAGIEEYYYRDGTYSNYRESEGWERMANQIPSCSLDYLQIIVPGISKEYQINISDDGESYVAWAPLCDNDCEYDNFRFRLLTFLPFTDPNIKDCIILYCVDSEGSAEKYKGSPEDLEATNCNDLFGK